MHATIEHSDWRVLAAPIGFGAAFTILGVACWKVAPGHSALGYLTMAGLTLYMAAWTFLFYSSPRRVELHDTTIIATFFGGRAETYSVGSLRRSKRPSASGTLFDLVELADEAGTVRLRVWKEMVGWRELIEEIETHAPTA
jgi:hypothetical protein